jgi:methionine-rich copper-binding protein CopC
MKFRFILPVALALLAATSPAAFAHTHIRATSIADNAVVAQSPANFTVAFTEPAAIANLTLTTTADAPVALSYQPPQGFATSYQIPMPHLDAGAYVISWRMIARDGHVMNGVVHFSIHAP